jgi:hypothetical protein
MILDLFRKEIEFNNIQGYDGIKDIVIVIRTKRSTHVKVSIPFVLLNLHHY